MAFGNGQAYLQVSEFSQAGIDVTLRKTIVEGSVLPLTVAGSLATIAIGAAGTGYNANDTFSIAGAPGAVGKVLTVSSGVPQTVGIVTAGSGGVATTGAATTNIVGTGSGLTITTTIAANGGQIAQITKWSITSNVLTLTANNSFTTGGGQSITVSGFTGSYTYLNGTYTVTSATATTIVVPLTHANASGTQQGVAVVQPTYITGGIPLSYNFVDLLGLPNPIGTIGPLSVPAWIDVKTVAASAYNYKVNTTVTPNLLQILSGVTEVSLGTAITADTVSFRAEFAKNAF